MDRDSYEAFAGTVGATPVWSRDLKARSTVFKDPAGVGWVLSVSYNLALKRYLLATDHEVSNRGNLGVFDAPEPWGSWTTALYLREAESSNFGNGKLPANTFFWNFPAKWQDPNGLDFTMVFTGSGRGKDNDSFNLIRGRYLPHKPALVSREPEPSAPVRMPAGRR